METNLPNELIIYIFDLLPSFPIKAKFILSNPIFYKMFKKYLKKLEIVYKAYDHIYNYPTDYSYCDCEKYCDNQFEEDNWYCCSLNCDYHINFNMDDSEEFVIGSGRCFCSDIINYAVILYLMENIHIAKKIVKVNKHLEGVNLDIENIPCDYGSPIDITSKVVFGFNYAEQSFCLHVL